MELQIPPLRYAPVGMTKGEVALPGDIGLWLKEQQVPPLRCAPVGMTQGEWGFHSRSVARIPGLKSETWGTLRFLTGWAVPGHSFPNSPRETAAPNEQTVHSSLNLTQASRLLGMTRGGWCFQSEVVSGGENSRSLHFASVGMTNSRRAASVRNGLWWRVT